MKQGTEYELLIAEIFSQLSGEAIVKHNDKLYDKNSQSFRQIDVSIRHTMADLQFLTIIEVKDYKYKVGVSVVDSFARVLEDVNANKGIIISAKGFSKIAKDKAKNLGIELLTFHSARNKNWETVVNAVVERTTYHFDVNYNYTSDFIPVKEGDKITTDPFLSYNRKDLIFIHDIIIDQILKKYSLRDLKKTIKLYFKDLDVYGLVNEEFIKITDGFISAKFHYQKNEKFYILPKDYIVKKDHLKDESEIKNMIWDFNRLISLLSEEVVVDNSIVQKPHIELKSYRFSDRSSSGSIKFNVNGGIVGDLFIKGNTISNYDTTSERLMKLENKFKND